jgi:hypothetical protein
LICLLIGIDEKPNNGSIYTLKDALVSIDIEKTSNISAIIGGTIGGVLAVLALIGISFFICQKKKNSKIGTNDYQMMQEIVA